MNPFVRNLSQQFNNNMVRLAGENFRQKRYLVALSGGCDSIALCQLAQNAGLNILAAHCNFGLRGTESEDDEYAVRQFCEKNGIDLDVRHFETKKVATEKKQSIQVIARKLRYDWFEELCAKKGIDHIITGHHKDDHIETFILNLTRGSGPKGLKGIPEFHGRIIRPLLTLERIHLEMYCKVSLLTYREDSSNRDSKYKRNFVRNEVLPMLYNQFPGLKDNLINTMNILGKYNSYVSERVGEELAGIISENKFGSKLHLDRVRDKDLIPFIVREYMEVRGFSSSDIEDMIHALKINKSGIHLISVHKHHAYSDRQKIVYLDKSPQLSTFHFELKEGSFDTDFGILEITRVQNYTADKNELLLPPELRGSELIIRTKEDGDRITSMGMDGQKQKLQDVFTNAKLDYLQKQIQPVIEFQKMILWIPGVKRSQEFQVSKSSESFLLSFKRREDSLR